MQLDSDAVDKRQPIMGRPKEIQFRAFDIYFKDIDAAMRADGDNFWQSDGFDGAGIVDVRFRPGIRLMDATETGRPHQRGLVQGGPIAVTGEVPLGPCVSLPRLEHDAVRPRISAEERRGAVSDVTAGIDDEPRVGRQRADQDFTFDDIAEDDVVVFRGQPEGEGLRKRAEPMSALAGPERHRPKQGGAFPPSQGVGIETGKPTI